MQEMTVRDAIGTGAMLALLVGGSAAAQERPATMPTRDVDIVYGMAAPGPDGAIRQVSQRMRWDIEAGEMRVDTPDPGVYTIMDYHAHKLLVVRDPDRSIIVMHAGGVTAAPGVSHDAQFARLGTDAIAGLTCTEWQTHDAAGRATTVCLTGDGVLLRVRSGGTVLVQATQVSYGTQPAALFVPPAGYRRITPPQ